MAWVYIMTNRKFGTLYIGATTDLVQRVWQHKGEFVPASPSAITFTVWFISRTTIQSMTPCSASGR